MHEIAIQNVLWRISSRESSRFLPVGCVPRSLTRTKSTLQYNVHLLWAKKKKKKKKERKRPPRKRLIKHVFPNKRLELGDHFPRPLLLHPCSSFSSVSIHTPLSRAIFILGSILYFFKNLNLNIRLANIRVRFSYGNHNCQKKKKKEFALKYSTIFYFPLTLSNFFFGFFNRKAQYVYYRYN